MSTTKPLFEITGLRSWFETPAGLVRAVEDVSLHVGAGERVGIVGESGSGKTQLFFAVLGLSSGYPGVVAGSARMGEVAILDGLAEHVTISPNPDHPTPAVAKRWERWNRIHHARLDGVLGRDMAILFQDPRRSLIPYWTISRHLSEALARHSNNGDAESRAMTLLSSLGFRDPGRVMQSFPEQLSGGEAQRAMLALTMAMQPRLLVADEPTTGLDAINQVRVLQQLRSVQEEAGLALVLISHDLSVVERVVDRVVVMLGGRILERAPVSILAGGDAGGARHPYTRSLRESQERRSAGRPIRGRVDSTQLRRTASGCPFAARCSLRNRLSLDLQSLCSNVFPPETIVSDDHAVACWGVST